MAIIVNASGEYIRRTANLPSDSNWTGMCWMYLTSIRSGQYQYVIALEDGASSASNYQLIGFTNSGIFEIANNTLAPDFSSSPSAGAWYHVYLRNNGTNLSGGWRGVSSTSYVTQSTGSAAAFTEAALFFGNDSYDEYMDVRLAGIKVWDAHLTDAEIELEWMRLTPARTANLNIWTPGVLTGTNRVKDWSGNGRDWTAGGTLSDGDGPPVPWGASPILVGKSAATSDITQALTGYASSSAAGTLAPSHFGGLSGQAATASAGTLAPSHSQALTGSAVTTSAGTLVGSKAAAIAGQAATATAGTLAPEHAQALSGQAATAAAGTITYTAGVAAALTGQAATASAGTVGPEHAQALTGQAATAAAGTITYSGSTSVNVALSGQAATASAGTIAPSHSQALSGQSATASAGTVAYTSATLLEIALTGQSASASAGTMTRSAAIAAAGQSVTAQAGTVTTAASRTLTGQSASASAGALSYVPGISIALTGQAVTASAGTMSLAVALLLAGSDIVIDAGTMTISGAEPVLRYAPDAHTIIGDARVRSAAAAERVRSAAAAARVRTHIGDN